VSENLNRRLPSLGIVITVYYPSAETIDYIASLACCFSIIVIVDNSEPAAECLNVVSGLSNVTVLCGGKNLGIAAALNVGCDEAFSDGCEQVILLDQDSRLRTELFTNEVFAMIETLSSSSLFGVSYSTRETSAVSCVNKADYKVLDVITLITSGTVLSKSLYGQLGYFWEHLFIDSVDHEYCLRARLSGVGVKRVELDLLRHSIGIGSGFIPVHDAERKYYIFRNVLLVSFKYWPYFPLWVLKQFFRLLVELVHVVLFEGDKLEKLAMVFRGATDGLRGTGGSYSERRK